jgi:chondroitin AC lyase
MCSKKIQSTESGNGENLLGAHLSDGATYIYQSGREYKNIFPVWNWHRIPGVTSYSNKKLPSFSWGGLHNGSSFVGGVSDSIYGAATMLFKLNDLTAHKEWFFGPNGVICLGAGITSNQGYDVLTTLNQSLLNGPIVVKKDSGTKILSVGQHTESNDINWVYHNGVGYLFLQKERVHAGAAEQQGSWHRIHETASSKSIQKKVFNLWIDHGSRLQDGSYAYMIMPAISRNKLTNFAANPIVKILQNRSSLQAIRYTKANLTEMIFYRPGFVDLSESTKVSADNQCLLMVRQINDGLKITVSVPPELKKHINLTISGHYIGKNCKYKSKKDQTTISFELPKDIYAGQSVSRIVKAM